MSDLAPRIVFLGMPCETSAISLQVLVEAGFDPAAVFIAGSSPAREDPVLAISRRRGIPFSTLRSVRFQADQRLILQQRPDLIVVSCFPWRLPPEILGLPRLGCVNVHPSLLPVGRGPEPVFWTLRRGERETGATIHLMDEGLDTGPILAQARVPVPLGVRAPDLERQLSELSGRLLVESIVKLANGSMQPRRQDSAVATAAPAPTTDDYLVPTNLPASWAYGFVRGVSPLGGPLTVWVGATGQRLLVLDATSWDTEPMSDPIAVAASTITVRFTPGRVTFACPHR